MNKIIKNKSAKFLKKNSAKTVSLGITDVISYKDKVYKQGSLIKAGLYRTEN